MSRLFCTESGFVIPTMGEELNRRRWARKTVELPATGRDGRLFVLADSHVGNRLPLRIRLNGRELDSLHADEAGYRWHERPMPADILRTGPNEIELWSDNVAMDGWALGVEYGRDSSGSTVSTDAGRTWSSRRLGHLNVGPGEYLVRVRLEEGEDPPPPTFVPGAPDDEAAAELRRRLPAEVLESGDTIRRVRRLATWTSTSWRYRNDHEAAQYAPWDPLTCLAWGAAERGHYEQPVVAMCVQYAVVFVAACAALGIPARPAVFADAVNGQNGHFAAEVWLASAGRWVFVDPNEDAMFYDGDCPMSVEGIMAAGDDLARRVRWGPGHTFQTRRPAMRRWIREVLLRGVCFRHRGVWPRSDFTAHPELTPPAHGCTAFSELDIVWESVDLKAGFGMFRYFADPSWFTAPPAEIPIS
jgi:hypothetical protein